jgi:hypothetical protein
MDRNSNTAAHRKKVTASIAITSGMPLCLLVIGRMPSPH